MLAVGLCLAALGAIPTYAQFSVISTPASSYTSATTLMSIPGANSSTTSTLTDGAETLTFSSTLTVATVPSGGWSTWNSPPATESSTPKVLWGNGLTSLTITLSSGATIFGFEIEPNNNGAFNVTATFYNGATVLGSVPLTVNGMSGALLAAASSTSSPITSVVVTAPAGAGGFAMAQFRHTASAVPALGLPGLAALALALLAAGAFIANRGALART
jgi:hypothetical protein